MPHDSILWCKIIDMNTKLFMAAFTAFTFVCQAQHGTVVLTIDGIQLKKGGELSAGIFKKETFPKVRQQFIGKEVSVNAGTMTIVFENVPEGMYAVAVFQDIDANKDLKTNFVGLPQEPIGFSQDARISFGPPSFEDAKFEVQAGQQTKLKITLR